MVTYAELSRIRETKFAQVVIISSGAVLPAFRDRTKWFIDVAGYTPAPKTDGYYDIQADVFSDTHPTGGRDPVNATPLELWFERVTDDERGRIFVLMDEDAGWVTLTQIQRGRLKAYVLFSLGADELELDSSEADYVFNVLESKKVIDAGRADEILA